MSRRVFVLVAAPVGDVCVLSKNHQVSPFVFSSYIHNIRMRL